MSALSDYLEAAILNATLRGTTFPAAPANVYIALSTAATTDAGGITEPSGNGYARAAVSTTGGFSAPTAAGVVSNIADIVFAAASGAGWGTVTYVAIFDALTGGNMLYHGALGASKAVGAGDVFKILAGQLSVTIA